MLTRLIGKIPATRRIENILNKFDEQVTTLEESVVEIDEETAALAARAERLTQVRTRAANAARRLKELVSA